MFNRVFLIGNLTRDPEVRYLPSGTAVATIRLAVSERFRDRNQELREDTLFIDVDAFDRLAETCAQYLKKGKRVFVEGKLRIDSWEAKDGTKRSRPIIRASMVRFLDPRSADGEAPAAAPQPRQAAPSAPPAQAAPADAPAQQDVPEIDINEPPAEADSGQSGTNDDLPF